jgi:hypothetical protein
MPQYRIIAVVEAPNEAAAEQVANERLGHDEDYGFDYIIREVSVLPAEPDTVDTA